MIILLIVARIGYKNELQLNYQHQSTTYCISSKEPQPGFYIVGPASQGYNDSQLCS